ncbi:MAG: hypothetical protein HOP00_13075 [Nitrospira sp.]|nr:hypothetical protein [Nitrospira sp.]
MRQERLYFGLFHDGHRQNLLYQNAEKVCQLRSLPSPKRLRAGRSHRSEAQRTARVRLTSSLAAALLDSLFEHPDAYVDINTIKKDFNGDASNDPSTLLARLFKDGG